MPRQPSDADLVHRDRPAFAGEPRGDFLLEEFEHLLRRTEFVARPARVAELVAKPTLADAVAATGAFDIVDVFRRPEFCAEHAREAVAAGAGTLWLQLGIASWEAARIASEAGLGIVMDRCILVEHRRLVR